MSLPRERSSAATYRETCERAWAVQGSNRGLMASAWWNLLFLIGSLIALPFDHRRILGLNPWIKPIKFEVSILVFVLTLALIFEILGGDILGRDILGKSGRWARSRALLTWGIGLSMILEITIIAMQSARGVPSHMNYTTVFNGVAFGVMGVGVAISTACVAVLLFLVCITPIERPQAELLGIRLGLALVLVASLEGVRIVAFGSHTVGAPDGGPGLPFLNWSTGHGDLRAAHFFALHALQLLWFTGWQISRRVASQTIAVATTCVAVLAYGGGIWFLFAQAMAGRPLLRL